MISQEFINSIEKSLNNTKNRSSYLKNIYLHLSKKPADSLFYWKYKQNKILILQTLILPFLQKNKINSQENIDNEDYNSENGDNFEIFCQDVITTLNILQIIVRESEIRKSFLELQFPFYIYPYLNESNLNKQYESLRIASLGVFAQMIKDNDKETINYLMTTEMVPLTLKIMDIGSLVSKNLAIFIFYTILNSESGLKYVTQTFERFIAILVILNSMLTQILEQFDKILLKKILKCYLKLAEMENVLKFFLTHRPEALFDKDIIKIVEGDEELNVIFKAFQKIICPK